MATKPLTVCMLSTMYLRHRTDTRGLMVAEINRLLRKQGIRVIVVAPSDVGTKNKETIDGIEVRRFQYCLCKKNQRVAYGSGMPTNLRKSWLAWLQLPFFMGAFFLSAWRMAKKTDIIHCQWLFTGLIGVMVGRLTGKPVIVQVRRVNPKGMMGKINRIVLRQADYVIFNSSYTENECNKMARPKASSIILNTIDTNRFTHRAVPSLRQKLGLSGKKVLFTMGLLVEKKGFRYLLEAMPAILEKHPETVLLIAGDGVERRRLETLARKLRITKQVRFLGTVPSDKTPDYHRLADIFVLPSIIDSRGETETLGVVLLEAMASGKPVVASHVGGIPDVVNADVGILVEQKDSVGLSGAVIQLLDDHKKRKSMGLRGRSRVEKVFSREVLRSRYRKIYDQILDQRSR